MSRTISVAIEAAVSQPYTSPGYLLEILFDPPVRLCTRGTLSVLGSMWTGWNFSVAGIGVQSSTSKQAGTLSIANTELDISTLILSQGISDRSIKAWKFYGDAPADDDPVLLFAGVGAQADIDTNAALIKVTLRQARDNVQFAPDKYITKEQGFSMLPAPGTIITIGKNTLILEPESV